MIRCLIVDDEPHAIEVLRSHLQHFDDVQIVGTCQSAIEAEEALKNHRPDVVFLDIQMPQISGLAWLENLTDQPLIVITTAYPQYALEGYRFNVIDYLIKPIGMERLLTTIRKIRQYFQALSTPPEKAEFFFVKVDKKLVRIPYDQLLYVEGLKDYVVLYVDGKRMVTLQTMKHMEEKLPYPRFLRVHRSYIVNTSCIAQVSNDGVLLQSKSESVLLPVSKKYRPDLENYLRDNLL